MKHTALALLFASLALAAKAEVQILPAGEFKGIDGRPTEVKNWKLSDEAGRMLAAKLNERHRKIKFNFDYEHQMMLAAQNGKPAPASGWSVGFEWRDGQGLFAIDVEWTEKARAMIEAKEYLYISPVISYDKTTGEITDVVNASLVNRPALEMDDVSTERLAALSSFSSLPNPEESSPMKANLIALLALATTATDDDVVNAVKSLKADATARHASLSALNGALGLPADADAAKATTAVAALKAQAVTGDDTAKTTIAALQAQVAALQNASNAKEVDALVTAALQDGKLLPAQKDWAVKLGQTDVAQLKSFIASAVPVAKGLGESQSQGDQGKENQGTAALSAEQLAVATAMGLTAEQYAKANA